MNTALAHSPGSYTPRQLTDAMDGLVTAGRLHHADTGRREPGFTTDLALAAETQTLAMLDRARGASAAVIAPGTVERHLAGGRLTDGQNAAVKTILASEDRIVGVQGYAGSGKTTMLAEMRGLAEAQLDGRAIIGLAPSASAARTLEPESGIESHTLQHFLARYSAVAGGKADRAQLDEARSRINGAIIIVDEASLASTRQMHGLMKVSEALSPGRLVLVGDTKQLDAVDAGVPFRQLEHAGMETAVMDQIMRQHDPELKAAVLDTLDDKPAAALDKLGKAPLVFSPEEFAAMPHGLSWDASDIKARMRAWQAIANEEDMSAMHAKWQTPFEPAEHPDGAIYENFPAFDQDAAAMRAFHDAAPAEKPQAMEGLTDKRFRAFAKRIIFDNFPELITNADKAAYDRAIIERLNREDDVPWVTVGKALEDAKGLLNKHSQREKEIIKIVAYVQTKRLV